MGVINKKFFGPAVTEIIKSSLLLLLPLQDNNSNIKGKGRYWVDLFNFFSVSLRSNCRTWAVLSA